MTAVVVGSDDWFDDTRTIRTTAAFEFQVTTLRPCSLLNFSAISKSTARQTQPSFLISERRHALLLRAITANLSTRPILTGAFIREAIKLFCRQNRATIVIDAAAPTLLRTLKPKLSLHPRATSVLGTRGGSATEVPSMLVGSDDWLGIFSGDARIASARLLRSLDNVAFHFSAKHKTAAVVAHLGASIDNERSVAALHTAHGERNGKLTRKLNIDDLRILTKSVSFRLLFLVGGHANFCLTLQVSHDGSWHPRLLRSRSASCRRWL